ncbi:MAG TPA: hypothetical protein VMW19_15075 [Myxococcota bacterium]|nr:hypothetical protein [Myxococcota bacterium]
MLTPLGDDTTTSPASAPDSRPSSARTLAMRDRMLHGFCFVAATVCFAAAISMLALMLFRFERDLLSAADFGLLVLLVGCFVSLGGLALLAMRDNLRQSSLRSFLVVPALVICWLLLLVTTLVRFELGPALNHVRSLASFAVVILALVFLSGWSSEPVPRRSATGPSPRPRTRDSTY